MKEIHKLAQYVITDEEFNNELHRNVEALRKTINEGNVKGAPMIVTIYTRHHKNKPFTVIPVTITDLPEVGAEFSRYKLFAALGAKYYKDWVGTKPSGEKCFPVAIFVNAEAWARKENSQEDFDRVRKTDWKTLPGSKEVGIVFGATIDARGNMAIMDVLRNEDEIITFGEPEYMDYDGKTHAQSDLIAYFYIGFKRAMEDHEDNNLN